MLKRLAVVVALLLLAPSLAAVAGADAASQITWAVHTTLVPTYFDPAETTIITSFMVLYALHDGVVKPMPARRSRRAWPNRGPSRPMGSSTISSCAVG